MTRVLVILKTALLCVLLAIPVQADQDAGAESVFSLGAGARSLGMGNAFTAVGGDASTVFFNPALLSRLEWQEVSLMHTSLFEGTIYNYASYVHPSTRWGGFGISVMRLGTNDIIKSQQYINLGTFSYADVQAIVAYGKSVGGGLSVGSSLKFVQQYIDTYSDNGFAADIGASWQINDMFTLAIAARDVIPARMKLRHKQETTPITFLGGIALTKELNPSKLRINFAADAEKIEGHDVRWHSGSEAVIDSTISVRLGYDRDNVTLGAGITYNRLRFDYAFRPVDYVEDYHRFSLSVMLGTSISDQLGHERSAEEAKGSVIIETERQKQFSSNKERGDIMYRQYDLDSALSYYERALAFDPGNANVIGTIAAVKQAIDVRESRELQVRQMERDREISIISYYDQAKSFFERKYYTAALEILDQLLHIDPNNTDAIQLRYATEAAKSTDIAQSLSRAQDAAAEGQYIRAVEHYTKILELDPANEAVKRARFDIEARLEVSQRVNTAIDLYKLGQYSDSRRIFAEVLQTDKNHALAKEYVKRIDRALAAPPALQAIENDKDVWPLYLEGLRLMREKQYAKAIEMWERVLDSYPNNQNTLDNIKQARLRMQSEPK